jgi:hypothetical protein
LVAEPLLTFAVLTFDDTADDAASGAGLPDAAGAAFGTTIGAVAADG